MNIFDTDFLMLGRQLLPTVLRSPLIMAITDTVAEPLRRLLSSLNRYRSRAAYRLSITPQVCYLEMMLNDRYDDVERRITITDGSQVDETYLYVSAEDMQCNVSMASENSPVYIFTDNEPAYVDFVVNVPTSITQYQAEASVLIDKNKLAGKTYNYNIQS